MLRQLALSVSGALLASGVGGCALHADITAGTGTETCATLATLRTEVRLAAQRPGVRTLDDLRGQLSDIDRTLSVAWAQSTGPARQVIANLQGRLARSLGSMSDLSGDTRADQWPKSIRSGQRAIRAGYEEAWERLGCS